jgi:hypothetical protein
LGIALQRTLRLIHFVICAASIPQLLFRCRATEQLDRFTMTVSFAEWRATERRKFNAALRGLRERPQAPNRLSPTTKRLWRSWWLRRTALAVLGVGCLAGGLEAWKPWPLTVTLKHLVAARNCDAARSVGLAPARKGEPGYWQRNDRDNDGVACEPWSGRW